MNIDPLPLASAANTVSATRPFCGGGDKPGSPNLPRGGSDAYERSGDLDATEMEKFRAMFMGETLHGEYESEVVETYKEIFKPADATRFSIAQTTRIWPDKRHLKFARASESEIDGRRGRDRLKESIGLGVLKRSVHFRNE